MFRHPLLALTRTSIRCVLMLVALCVAFSTTARAETIARCGQGWLETIDGYPVLHLKGSPYEMGYQHGALLKQSIRENFRNTSGRPQECLVQDRQWHDHPSRGLPDRNGRGFFSSGLMLPKKYFEELSKGSRPVPRSEIRRHLQDANFLPEMFHCSGFAVMNSATTDGTLYHGRVLDYSVTWHLQDHAVLIICEPDGGTPFVNVSFAGFIGSVTGMNARHISIGEMGGAGQGHWAGVPMPLLVREALETAGDLDAAVAVFRDHPRTCQYFYVIADGNTNRAVGMECTPDKLRTIDPGQPDPLLPHAVKDCVLLSAGKRYEELARRAEAGVGKFDAESARHLMDCGVAGHGNLHDVLFAPASTKFWVANASSDGKPAADQPYHAFQLSELLTRPP